MSILLTANEARVLGCLLEKSVITPDQYPLTLNALTNACNQKSSREPVMSLEPGTVQAAVRSLQDKHLIRSSIIYFNSGGGHQIDVHNNIRVSYSNVQGGYSGAGNLSLSPALCPDTFALLAGSPCIDAGHPALEFRDSVISSDVCSPYARGTRRNDMGAFGGPGVVGWTEPYAEPVIRIAPVNRMGFEGQPVTLDVLATGIDPLAYQWLHQGQGLTGETNAVLSISSAALEHAGDYSVEVRNALGSVVSVPVRLGIAKLETRTDGQDQGRPRLLIRNGQAGQQCAI